MQKLILLNNYSPKIKYYFKGDKMKLVTFSGCFIRVVLFCLQVLALIEKSKTSGLKESPRIKQN